MTVSYNRLICQITGDKRRLIRRIEREACVCERWSLNSEIKWPTLIKKAHYLSVGIINKTQAEPIC